MTNEPDSEAHNFESIEVMDTPGRDNPKFGSVTLRIGKNGRSSQTLRMTFEDAETLKYVLTEYLWTKYNTNEKSN